MSEKDQVSVFGHKFEKLGQERRIQKLAAYAIIDKDLVADILKLNLAAGRKGGRWRKILLFADESACKLLRGSSWLAEACKDSQIEIEVAEISQETREKIAATPGMHRIANVPDSR